MNTRRARIVQSGIVGFALSGCAQVTEIAQISSDSRAHSDVLFKNSPKLRLAYLEGYLNASEFILAHPTDAGAMGAGIAPRNDVERAYHQGYSDGWIKTTKSVADLQEKYLNLLNQALKER
jgi:hypothetical protein